MFIVHNLHGFLKVMCKDNSFTTYRLIRAGQASNYEGLDVLRAIKKMVSLGIIKELNKIDKHNSNYILIKKD